MADQHQLLVLFKYPLSPITSIGGWVEPSTASLRRYRYQREATMRMLDEKWDFAQMPFHSIPLTCYWVSVRFLFSVFYDIPHCFKITEWSHEADGPSAPMYISHADQRKIRGNKEEEKECPGLPDLMIRLTKSFILERRKLGSMVLVL